MPTPDLLAPAATDAELPAATEVGPRVGPAVHLISLGCARNDVDSEELAARLELGGFRLTGDAAAADAIVVNTCGFVESAKKDSVDTLLAAADLKEAGRARAVVAVGCLAERYGTELAEALPEADAVLGFDAYSGVSARLRSVLAGEPQTAHVPRDRRALLPLTPTARAEVGVRPPGHGTPELPAGVAPASGPPLRRRLSGQPWAPLKLASGCDRRCTFCAIPAFRGAYLSRPPAEVLAEARWLAEQGVREVLLVSENTTSYGKDLGDLRALEALLPALARVDGLEWVRVSYLQPAELRPGLIEALARTPKVVPYFDLSFQHAAPSVLRRMRRFGGTDSFLALLDRVRSLAPTAGIRSNVICGFPGESEADLEQLARFLVEAELDAIGVFGYSDEDGTEAARLDGQLPTAEIERRREWLADLADELVTQRAEARIGENTEVLVEEVGSEVAGAEVASSEVASSEVTGAAVVGRALHQGPEVDGTTTLRGVAGVRVGELVAARISGASGVDLVSDLDTRVARR